MRGLARSQASSGKTVRHRLNRGGDRQANTALWRDRPGPAALGPAHPRLRRPAHQQGKTTKEIIRCLKRYLARELFPLLKADLQQATAAG